MFMHLKGISALCLLAAMVFSTACRAPSAESTASDETSQQAVAAESTEGKEAKVTSHDDHDDYNDAHAHSESLDAFVAALSPVNLAEGEQLEALASTTIVGDWVRNVAGDAINLSVLMPIGADLHSFEPTPSDLAAIADANVIFMIGLNAEEQLMESLENAGGEAIIVPVSMGLELSEMAEGEGDDHGDEDHADEDDEHGEEHDEHHDHGGVDPHVWTTPYHAIPMTHNIEVVLSALDPARTELYETNAEAYEAQLEEVDLWVRSQIETIPVGNRELVTDHSVFGYYAERYGLTQVGAVLPSFSTNAEPTAQELAELQDAIIAYDVSAIFVGTTINPSLSNQIAQDTGKKLLTVYTGSLGPGGSGAETFIDYIKYNTNAFVEGLSQR